MTGMTLTNVIMLSFNITFLWPKECQYPGYDKLSRKDWPRTVILSSKYRDRFQMQVRELHFCSLILFQLSYQYIHLLMSSLLLMLCSVLDMRDIFPFSQHGCMYQLGIFDRSPALCHRIVPFYMLFHGNFVQQEKN